MKNLCFFVQMNCFTCCMHGEKNYGKAQYCPMDTITIYIYVASCRFQKQRRTILESSCT